MSKTSKCKFKVGDYVIGNGKTSDCYASTTQGWVGKVVTVHKDGTFDAMGHGRFLPNCTFESLNPSCFDLYTKDQPNKIVITTDGYTTTAKMYRDKQLIEVQTTKCHPDDRFDFKVGARVAFDRLVGEKKEEPKYYNGKVVCVDDGCFSFYTVGKIYQFVDGHAIDDMGCEFSPMRIPFKSFEQFQEWSDAKWLEVVE